MIQCSMDFYDVLFPVNLGPLTYGCDQALSSTLKPGMMVSAQLKNKNMKGIVIGKSMSAPGKKVKVIRKVHGEEPILSSNMITLLTWMSEYYLVHHGLGHSLNGFFIVIRQMRHMIQGFLCFALGHSPYHTSRRNYPVRSSSSRFPAGILYYISYRMDPVIGRAGRTLLPGSDSYRSPAPVDGI